MTKNWQDVRATLLDTVIEIARKNEQPSVADTEQNVQTTQASILELELDFADRELKELNQAAQYKRNKYTVSALEGDVRGMETGLPTKQYFAGWNVESISFGDHIFIT